MGHFKLRNRKYGMDEKKTYESPKLVVLGNFEALTQQTKFVGFNDGGPYTIPGGTIGFS